MRLMRAVHTNGRIDAAGRARRRNAASIFHHSIRSAANFELLLIAATDAAI